MAEIQFQNFRGEKKDWKPFLLAAAAVVVIIGAAIVMTSRGQDDDASSLSRASENVTPNAATQEVPNKQKKSDAETSAQSAASSRAERQLAEARASADVDRLRRTLGTLVLDESASDLTRRAWLAELAPLNERLVWSRGAVGPEFVTTKVQPGDSYWKIARRLRDEGTPVAEGLLLKLNGIAAARLRHGISLKVPKERLRLVVDKSDRVLYLAFGAVVIGHYPVGVGRDERTPNETFTIGGKTKMPAWTHPETGEHFEPGAPGNQIGTRWMRFYRNGESTGLGIHGTNDPDSIGKAVSLGCIRLRNADVEELYDLVCDGTEVTIRP